ncbi:MAG TPA: hypothetical protein VF788_07190, partial [Pseudonocardiaceae bacterium]
TWAGCGRKSGSSRGAAEISPGEAHGASRRGGVQSRAHIAGSDDRGGAVGWEALVVLARAG